MWIVYAAGSALFGGVVSILAKCGIKKTDSTVATAIRTSVVLVFSWLMVIINPEAKITEIGMKQLVFLILSGLATGASWLCYFHALSIGNINTVVPIDKSSQVLTILLAIIVFGEYDNLLVRLVGAALILLGTLMMIEIKQNTTDGKRSAIFYAFLSAIFAALTSVLAKIGTDGINSDFGTAVRTCVVFVMAWLMLPLSRKTNLIREVPRSELLFLFLSGIATGASWLCYFRALSIGDAGVVVSIDKLSILVAILFSRLVFGEKLSKKSAAGLALIVIGTVGMAVLTN